MPISQDIKASLNAVGDAPIFACRAWVRFNGSGVVAILGSGNVTSITDHGVGDYSINFSVNMPRAEYATAGIANNVGSNSNAVMGNSAYAPTISAYRFNVRNTSTGATVDPTFVSMIFSV